MPEPVLPGGVVDPGAVFGRPREFINAGDQVVLCVAIKLDGDGRSFAFNNRSYLHPNWGNLDWALPDGTYWVRVRVIGAEIEATRVFYLVNSGNQRAGLRLHEAQP